MAEYELLLWFSHTLDKYAAEKVEEGVRELIWKLRLSSSRFTAPILTMVTLSRRDAGPQACIEYCEIAEGQGPPALSTVLSSIK